jgi:hypothetical protein
MPVTMSEDSLSFQKKKICFTLRHLINESDHCGHLLTPDSPLWEINFLVLLKYVNVTNVN